MIGGGTFGRLLKRGVAFGAMFPDYVNTMHQANEFADVEDLYRAAAILRGSHLRINQIIHSLGQFFWLSFSIEGGTYVKD